MSKNLLNWLLILVVLSAATFNVSAIEDKKAVLGMAMIDLTNPAFVQLMEGANIAAEEDGNIEIIWNSAENSLEKQISIIENLVEQRVDVILIDPLDVDAVKPAMKKAYDAGIHLVTMGNYVETPYGNVSTLYGDRVLSKNLNRILFHSLDGEGNVVYIFGKKGNFCSDERYAGFEDAAKEFPNINVLAMQPGEWDPALAQRIMEDFLTAHPQIDGLSVWHDGIMYGAMTAVRSAGLAGEIKVVSIDGDVESSEMIRDGEIVCDVLTGLKRIGAWNAKVGAALARGAELDEIVYLPPYYVMEEETHNMVIERGFKEDIPWVTPEEAIKIADSAYVEWSWEE